MKYDDITKITASSEGYIQVSREGFILVDGKSLVDELADKLELGFRDLPYDCVGSVTLTIESRPVYKWDIEIDRLDDEF